MSPQYPIPVLVADAPTVPHPLDSPAAGQLSDRWRGRFLLQLLVVAGFIALGVVALQVDMQVARWMLRDQALEAFNDVLEVFEPYGNGVSTALIVLCIFVCDVQRRWALPRVMTAALGAALIANLGKLLVARARPYNCTLDEPILETFRGLLPGLGAGSLGQGFPSAHVATAAGAALALGAVYPRGRWLFAGFACLVAVQRIETGAHFLSDTFWGAAVGFGFAALILNPDCLGSKFDTWERRSRSASTPLSQAPELTEMAKCSACDS